MSNDFPAGCATRFEPVRRIASGGYATVWLARDLRLDRPVAIKVLGAARAADAADVERFQAEARMAAALAHPHVVPILDHAVDDGLPWIAYAYVDGPDLAQKLKRGPLPWVEATRVGAQVAAALAAAHRLGIIHRDIKPENVLEASEGHYVLTDFGIAKWAQDSAVRTQTGVVLGSAAYIAPEILDGEPAGPLSDQYSLGLVLDELLSGKPVFNPASPADFLVRGEGGPLPTLAARGIESPPELEQALARMLDHEPRNRWPRMESLADRLAAILESHGAGMTGWVSLARGSAVEAVALTAPARPAPADDVERTPPPPPFDRAVAGRSPAAGSPAADVAFRARLPGTQGVRAARRAVVLGAGSAIFMALIAMLAIRGPRAVAPANSTSASDDAALESPQPGASLRVSSMPEASRESAAIPEAASTDLAALARSLGDLQVELGSHKEARALGIESGVHALAGGIVGDDEWGHELQLAVERRQILARLPGGPARADRLHAALGELESAIPYSAASRLPVEWEFRLVQLATDLAAQCYLLGDRVDTDRLASLVASGKKTAPSSWALCAMELRRQMVDAHWRRERRPGPETIREWMEQCLEAQHLLDARLDARLGAAMRRADAGGVEARVLLLLDEREIAEIDRQTEVERKSAAEALHALAGHRALPGPYLAERQAFRRDGALQAGRTRGADGHPLIERYPELHAVAPPDPTDR